MKKRPISGTRGGVLLAVCAAAQTTAGAATQVAGPLINIDFNGDEAGAGALTDPITFDGNIAQDEPTGASVAFEDSAADTNDIWNGWEGMDTHATLENEPQTLMDSTGAATEVTVTWSGFGFNYTNYFNGNDGGGGGFTDGPNGDGYYATGAATPLVVLNGLDPALSYDIVTIGAGDAVKFRIGGRVRDIARWHSVDNPSNWANFRFVKPDQTGQVTIEVLKGADGNFGIGGVQIRLQADTDRDGMADEWEDENGTDKASAADAALDADGDTLSNLTEFLAGTDPQNADTDADGLSDGVETKTGVWVSPADTGTDPLVVDTDGDTLPDGAEDFSAADGSDPNKQDTDGDGFIDPIEVRLETNPKVASSSPRRAVSTSLVNVDFNGTGGFGGSTDPVTFDGDLDQDTTTSASVPLEDADTDTDDVWNGFDSINQENQPLVDSAGQPTNLTLTWKGFGGTYTNYSNGHFGNTRTDGPNGDGHLVFNAIAGTATVTVGGLDSAKTYDISTIAGGGDPVSFAISGETKAIPGWNSGAGAATWAVFTNVVPAGAGTVEITVSANGFRNFGIGGLQITPRGTVGDADLDGMPDSWEDTHGLNKNNPADAAADKDGDGLTNLREYTLGTDPGNVDTDGDTLTDNVETGTGIYVSPADTGTNPLKTDTDGDSIPDGEEIPGSPQGTDPNKADTDGDGFSDPFEIRKGTDPSDPSSSSRATVVGTLINVDFDGTTGVGGVTDPVTFDGDLTQDLVTSVSVPFVDSAEGNDFWNGFAEVNLQDQPLSDSLGNPTDVLLSWSGFNFTYTNYLNGRFNNARTDGPNGDSHVVQDDLTRVCSVLISGLDPTGSYRIGVIAGSDPVTYAIDGDARPIGEWNSFTNPDNWTVFDAVTPNESGVVEIVVTPNNKGYFGIAGLQIGTGAASPTEKFRILDVTRNPANGAITLVWESVTGRSYSIFYSTGTTGFTTPVTGASALPGQAGSMSATFAPPVAGAGNLFFMVKSE